MRWVSLVGRRPRKGEVVVVEMLTMLGKTVLETATYENGAWKLGDGTVLERPDWILAWCRTPALPPASFD